MSSTADQANGAASSPSAGSAERPPSTDDRRVLDAVREYLALIEAGTPPDRAAFVARYPDVAVVLSECLEGLAFVQAVAPELSDPVVGAPAAGAESLTGTLGDFRLIREVGRGGMGVVYEAEQVSLGRRVALKVLPFAATMDPRQLRRFHNEARAAAGLHHTNIVPVYAVGCERGVHYYAMQFIDGRTLADLIAEHRGGPPSQVPTSPEAAAATVPPAAQATSAAPRDAAYFRRAAEWGIQAAEALDCAHAVGVVHRDVKPANLLVDTTDRLWVTDFGLAQVQSDTRLTMTGDLVGTLRYMSPEQALAKRAVLDHRADIYSLGATLYELLTLQPAFAGTDRQELLRQIAFEEPKAPRRIDNAIPGELETIVLKALEKNPQERYATAQDLADDLDRWLKDEPIRARRPSLVQRARKWSRRHRAVAIGLTAALAAAVVLAVVLGFWYQRRLADTERGVTAALAEADTLVTEGDKQTEYPERWQATARLALAAQKKAEELLANGVATEELAARVRQRRAAVDAAVTDSQLLVELERVRLEVTLLKSNGDFDFARAAPRYATLLAQYGVDLAAPQAAAARVRESRLQEALLAALTCWWHCSSDVEERKGVLRVYQLALPPGSAWARLHAGQKREDIARLVNDPAFQALPPAALILWAGELQRMKEKAMVEKVLRAALERRRGDFWLNFELGLFLLNEEPPRAEEAVCYLTAALALRSESPGVGLDLGRALRAKGDTEGAIARFQQAIELDPNYVAAHEWLGIVLAEVKDYEGAEREYREALRLSPESPTAHRSLGNLLADTNDPTGAVREYQEAIRIDPKDAVARTNLGNTLFKQNDLDGAIRAFRDATLVAPQYAKAHNGLGFALLTSGDLENAIASFRAALRADPNHVLANANLGNALLQQNDPEGAIKAFKDAVRLAPKNPAFHTNLAIALDRTGRGEDAMREFQLAIQLAPEFAEAHCNFGLLLTRLGRFREAVEELRLGHKLGSRNPHWPFPSARLLRDAERMADLDAGLPALLEGRQQPKDADERLGVARLCQFHKRLFAAAARWYGEAFAAQPGLADNLSSNHRYDAACAAAMAGCGQGEDRNRIDASEHARLRRQSLDWLRADLTAWNRLMAKEPGKAGPAAGQQLARWLKDTDLAGVRGPEALAKLPEGERGDWQKLWADVEEMLAKIRQEDSQKSKPAK
jgi:serine/threonine protein kinase/Flp pilus assembly protein TadD